MSACTSNARRTIATAFHSPNRPSSFRFNCPLLPNLLKFPSNPQSRRTNTWISVSCSAHQTPHSPLENEENASPPREEKRRRISEQSSWEAKDADGQDYLYRLGKEAENMNIAVGARQGIIDDLFVGNFLGKDSDIVTRSFQYLQGDYYIAPNLILQSWSFCRIKLDARKFEMIPDDTRFSF
ncbi:hypothetical protein ACLOJK_030703 [Asimina triloba]